MSRLLRTTFSQQISWNLPAIMLGVILLATWEILSRALPLRQSIVPPPSLIVHSLYVRGDLLIAHAWLTFSQTVLGFLISATIGIALGWAISKSRLVFQALYPLTVVLQAMPKEALAPLLILWFGAEMLSRTILACLIAFFPIVINTMLGVRSLDRNMRNYATSLCCSPWQVFAKVEFPSALKSIFAGMKISVTPSVIGVVVAEIVAGRSGLGYLLLFASSRLDMGFSLAILLVLGVWGGALFAALVWLERHLIFWRS
jgi:NitT/TauT family transport system permease protein